MRLKSQKKATREKAEMPYEFGELRYIKSKSTILVPRVSSERRHYIPFGFLDDDYLVSDSAQAIYNPEPWIFGVISSKIHMSWIKSIGGKLKSDYRYSSVLCYNTFPLPSLTQTQKDILEKHTHNILEQRAKHTEKTLAEMYDPEKMPEGLLKAHKDLDTAIEKCYRAKPFESDEERLAWLFKLYEQMIAEEKTKGTLFATEPKLKKSKKK